MTVTIEGLEVASWVSERPFKRRSARRGDLILLCRTGPQPKDDGCYAPRWHVAKLSKRRARPSWGPNRPDSLVWTYKNEKTGAFDVTRVWAYVPRCGAGHGYRATSLAYGKLPTCKRCLRRLGL